VLDHVLHAFPDEQKATAGEGVTVGATSELLLLYLSERILTDEQMLNFPLFIPSTRIRPKNL